MKKIIAGILVLVFALTMSGCVYWDGLSKSEAREFVEKTLEEKYGEEFVVKQMYLKAGSWDTASDLMADCSPKSDENIVFSTQTLAIGKERLMRDDYIQNVVRKQLKQNIDEVLSTYYDNFASEVYVTPLTNWYDSGIRSTNEDIVKKFSESFSNQEENRTSVWIILEKEEKKYGTDKLKGVLQDMIPGFYSLNIFIDCIFADEDTIKLCKEESKSINTNRWKVKQIVRNGNFPIEMFIIYNDERGLVYSGSELIY